MSSAEQAGDVPAGRPAVRPAGPEDVTTVLGLIHELADYERAPEHVVATPRQVAAALFGPDPRVHCHVAEVGGEVVGFALWYVTFSTWLGRHGLWLEDLFVRPSHRRLGCGRALLAELASLCRDRGYGRLEWSVLDWNEPARAFYRSLGAVAQEDWTVWRLEGPSLRQL